MKAYVIKNKEGKFFVGEDLYLKSFSCAKIFTKYEIKKVFEEIEMPKDCTIVHITISEGDLEEENRVLKKALELACETIDEHYTIDIDYLYEYERMEDYFIQKAKESEKDE